MGPVHAKIAQSTTVFCFMHLRHGMQAGSEAHEFLDSQTAHHFIPANPFLTVFALLLISDAVTETPKGSRQGEKDIV